ncbi:MAG: DUF6134 family protein [Catalinimonas sp.]
MLCLLLAAVLGGPSVCRAQALLYDVYKGDDHIGQLHALRRQEGTQTHYLMSSAVKFRVLFEVRLDFRSESTFDGSYLRRSFTRNQLNDRERDRSVVTRKGDGYEVARDDDDVVSLTHPGIEHNMSTIYYQEPAGLSRIFSDKLGAFAVLTPVAPHEYEMVLPDGQVNYFRYDEQGRCVEVECRHSLSTIYFRLRQ